LRLLLLGYDLPRGFSRTRVCVADEVSSSNDGFEKIMLRSAWQHWQLLFTFNLSFEIKAAAGKKLPLYLSVGSTT
jgi:hypothetical protein